MRVHRVPVVLPLDEYKRLGELAISHERDPWQQARWILRRALCESAPVSDSPANCDKLEVKSENYESGERAGGGW
jgi:hypothetical protein